MAKWCGPCPTAGKWQIWDSHPHLLSFGALLPSLFLSLVLLYCGFEKAIEYPP